MLGTAWKANRLSIQHHQTATQLLADYSAFAAWSYSAHLSDGLQETAFQVVGPIMHERLHSGIHMPNATSLTTYWANSIRGCGDCDTTARPSSYFAFTLGSDTLDVAGDELDAVSKTAINAAVTSRIRRQTAGNRDGGRMGIIGPVPETGFLVAFGLMPTVRLDTVVYGFVYEPAGFTATLENVLARGDLLPRAVSHGKPNRELLSLEVLDNSGQLLYRDPQWSEQTVISEERLPARAAGLIVRTTVRRSAADEMVSGGFSRDQLPILIGVVGLALLMALVAIVQLRRENQLSRIRSDFVASVSHELRTPLAQIRLFLDTLRLKRYSTDDQREWLVGHLVRETTRLEHLVDNVLQFSRLEHERTGHLNLEQVDLSQTTRETVTGFEPLARSRKAELELKLTEPLNVTVDQARYRQLLLNLLDNAVKFGPAGQRIRVTLEEREGKARLEVQDQGSGVPESERLTIWEPYFRGISATRSAAGGSGIGLAIVHDAVIRMNGRVWVESAPAGGAAFVVELPLVVEAPSSTNGNGGHR
jgi:signal transduction histidine kinase